MTDYSTMDRKTAILTLFIGDDVSRLNEAQKDELYDYLVEKMKY